MLLHMEKMKLEKRHMYQIIIRQRFVLITLKMGIYFILIFRYCCYGERCQFRHPEKKTNKLPKIPY